MYWLPRIGVVDHCGGSPPPDGDVQGIGDQRCGQVVAHGPSHRLAVVGVGGIGTLEIAQEFAASKGTTFTVLWSETRDAWEHYEMESTSDFLLLDRFGNRLMERPEPFDRAASKASWKNYCEVRFAIEENAGIRFTAHPFRRLIVARRRKGWSSALVAVTLLAATTTPLSAATDGGFSDVVEGGTHEPAVEALAELGIFEGTECEDDLFCPGDPIERWVIAVWLIRVLGGEVTPTETSRFTDVDASEWWSPHAEELANREITTGCETEPPTYCPDEPVKRAQMATFLVRAFDLPSAPAAGFTDTEGNTHEANIDAVADAGITSGCDTAPSATAPASPSPEPRWPPSYTGPCSDRRSRRNRWASPNRSRSATTSPMST